MKPAVTSAFSRSRRAALAALAMFCAVMMPLAAHASGARVLRDVSYGSDARQRFDVYIPARPAGPVIFMVHGGAWAFGDKASPGVVAAKRRHWVDELGYVLVSTNYRMLPKTKPLDQAKDVASALAVAQKQAAGWGADPGKFVLMGHSAGGHLVALLNASASLAQSAGAKPWRAAVVLDSAALDVEGLMRAPHLRLYDRAFGDDPAYWQAVSPYQQMAPAVVPSLLMVCSSRRNDACEQAIHYERKASGHRHQITIWQQDLSHGDISATLGAPSIYTDSVTVWIKSRL